MTLKDLRAEHRAQQRMLIILTLKECRGSRVIAAERLGINRTYLSRLIQTWKIDVPGVRGDTANQLARKLRNEAS